jgi:translation initiation factor 2 beta subunit (eIF-2beta)/eIF-5
MAANIKSLLDNNFEVYGLVKPGSNSNSLVTTVSHEIDNLINRDILLVCIGSNDLGVTHSNKILQNIINFTSRHNHTNIVLVKVPPHYDTANTIQVNNEIKIFNNKLMKCIKSYSHITVVEVDHNRKFFAKHGLNLNGVGKEKFSKQIVSHSLHVKGKHRSNSYR